MSTPPLPLYLQASSSTQLVEQLRALSQLPVTTPLPAFMKQFAHRFDELNDGRLLLRTDTTDHFIADLVSHGWLRLVTRSE